MLKLVGIILSSICSCSFNLLDEKGSLVFAETNMISSAAANIASVTSGKLRLIAQKCNFRISNLSSMLIQFHEKLVTGEKIVKFLHFFSQFSLF